MKIAPLAVCVIFVTIAAIGNLIRFIWSVPVMVGSHHIPSWTGIIAFLVLGFFAVWGFKALCPNCCGCSDKREGPRS